MMDDDGDADKHLCDDDRTTMTNTATERTNDDVNDDGVQIYANYNEICNTSNKT